MNRKLMLWKRRLPFLFSGLVVVLVLGMSLGCRKDGDDVFLTETASGTIEAIPGPYYPGTVLKTGTMAQFRLKHCAALLPNGNVLFAGGCGMDNGSFQRLNTAEEYNPRTGTATPVGDLTVRRTRPDAVPLNNGKALVIGGMTWMMDSRQDCDLYDPKTQTFTVCSQLMNVPRGTPQAVVLDDGKVLIVGGEYDDTSTPEVYDPAAGVDGTFTSTPGSLHDSLAYFTLTKLLDGKVLVAGGEKHDGTVFANAEIYDPADGSITAVGNMTTERFNHFAALMDDGRVFLGGGFDQSGTVLKSCEIYDPSDHSFTALPNEMFDERVRPQAITLSDGNILIAGGTDHLEVYIPAAGKFMYVETEVEVRYQSWSTKGFRLVELPDNTILIAGGIWDDAPMEIFIPSGVTREYQEDFDPSGIMAEAVAKPMAVRAAGGNVLVTGSKVPQIYNPVIDRFSFCTGMPIEPSRRGHAAAPLRGNGCVLLVGGESNNALHTAELYDPDSDAFSSTGGLSIARANPVAVNLIDGTVLVTGNDPSAEVYDPETETFNVTAGSMVEAKSGHTASLLGNGNVLVTGGSTGAAVATAEIYDWRTKLFAATNPMATPRARHFQITLRNGKVLVGGGIDGSGNPLATTEIWNPATATWKAGPALPDAMVDAKAVLLGCGKILIAGGRTTANGNVASSYGLYNPSTLFEGNVLALAPITAHADEAVVVLKDGRAVAFGGIDAAGTAVTQAEVMHLVDTHCTVQCADAPESFKHANIYLFPSDHPVQSVRDKVLLCCNFGYNSFLYDPVSDLWTQLGSLNTPRRLSGLWPLADGRIMIFGGDGQFTLLDETEIYDPATNSWSYGPNMVVQRGCPVGVELNDGRYLISGTWVTPGGDLFNPDGSHAGVTSNGFYGRGLPGEIHYKGDGSPGSEKVLIIGGYWGPVNRIPYCEIYDVTTDTWSMVADMHYPRGHLRRVCVLTLDNKALVTGGWDDNNVPLTSAEYYDIDTDTWTLLDDEMAEKRGGHWCVLMPNGQYFLLGIGKGGEFYDHATGLFTYAGLVYGQGREQSPGTYLPDGSYLFLGADGNQFVEKIVP